MTPTELNQICERVRSNTTSDNKSSIYKEISRKSEYDYMYVYSFFNRNKFTKVYPYQRDLAAIAVEVLKEVEKGGEDE